MGRSKQALSLTFPNIIHQKNDVANENEKEDEKLNIEGVTEGVKTELLKIYNFVKENKLVSFFIAEGLPASAVSKCYDIVTNLFQKIL